VRRAGAAFPALSAAGLLLAVGLPARLSGQRIEHFLRVDDRVCTGGQPTPAQLATLPGQGIRTVVDLRPAGEHDLEAERAAVRELGLGFVSIPVSGADPRPEQADAFLAITADPSIYPIFVHCASGNRVGAFWMIRRILVDGWSEQKAEEEARRIGLRSQNLLDFALDYARARTRER
jgi:uncharacterized protein (TIGR01244 family)